MDHDASSFEEKDCACRNLRMASRVITQLYDVALAPTGLSAGQFSMLHEIACRKEGISVSQLAKATMMDQTTATRNLSVLEKREWILIQPAQKDGRKKIVQISDRGRHVLKEARPYWESMQEQVNVKLGEASFRTLLQLLDEIKRMDEK